jgi:hypothetical protein
MNSFSFFLNLNLISSSSIIFSDIISEVIESLAYDDFQDFNFTFFTSFHYFEDYLINETDLRVRYSQTNVQFWGENNVSPL